MTYNFAITWPGPGNYFSKLGQYLICSCVCLVLCLGSVRADGVIIIIDDLIGYANSNGLSICDGSSFPDAGFSLSPNPGTTQVRVAVPSVDSLVSVTILTLSGETLYEITSFQSSTTVSLEPGTYIFRVELNDGCATRMWVLQS